MRAAVGLAEEIPRTFESIDSDDYCGRGFAAADPGIPVE